MQLQAIAGGYQFRTHPDNAVWVQKLLAQRPVRLTRAQLETLAICAYRQPITRPEIDEIRGVDSGGTLKTLMDRWLIRILGKKEEPGRPMLYGTTSDFLEFFNLAISKDLPTLREFHELSEEHRAQVEALRAPRPRDWSRRAEEAAAAERARMPLAGELQRAARGRRRAGRDRSARSRPPAAARSKRSIAAPEARPSACRARSLRCRTTPAPEKRTSKMEMRLQRFLAQAGVASRRKAEELITSGRVQGER